MRGWVLNPSRLTFSQSQCHVYILNIQKVGVRMVDISYLVQKNQRSCCPSLRSHCFHRCWGQYYKTVRFHDSSSGAGSENATPGCQQIFGQNLQDLPVPYSPPSSGAAVQRARLDHGSAADEGPWTLQCLPG